MVEPCSDSGSYRAEPTEETRLDLEGIEDHLTEKNFDINFSSEVLLLVLHPEYEVEVGIYPSGKLLFKTTDKEIVEKLFEEFSELVVDFVE